MTFGRVDGFYHDQIIATKTLYPPGTDEVFPTSGSVHLMEGSLGEETSGLEPYLATKSTRAVTLLVIV